MDCCFTSRLREVQAPQKGPEFGTWSQMGPKKSRYCFPKFLILPSDDAEKFTTTGYDLKTLLEIV